jgi:trans-aconitate 2-methyltransferase
LTTADWDAGTYDRISEPQLRWGLGVIDRMPEPPPGALVLDAGCGSGRVTEALLRRFPTVRVIALDVSASMVAQAAERLAPFRSRVESFVCADLTEPLPVPRVDVVFSTATFHWIVDHDTMFRRIADVLRPGGHLVAQCGGHGNLARVEAVAADLGHSWAGVKRFATAEETATRLVERGFVEVSTALVETPEVFDTDEAFELFQRTVTLRTILAAIPAEHHDQLVRSFTRRIGDRTLDYVRLDIAARRGPGELTGRSTTSELS